MDRLNKDVTLIIKTFKRPDCLERLISSIRKYYPNIKILIADDSFEDVKESYLKKDHEFDKNVDYYILPFDVGVSAGRNFMVDKLKTKYFVLLDDDYIFTEKTNLEVLYDHLENDRCDIIGGKVGGKNPCDYQFKMEIINNILNRIDVPCYIIDDLEYYDCIPNFFMAKSNISVRWDDDLKLAEHMPFFWDCKWKGVRTAYTDDVEIDHFAEAGNREYSRFRSNTTKFIKMSSDRMGYGTQIRLKTTQDHVNTNLFTNPYNKFRALNNLKDVTSVLNRLNIDYNVYAGTLLGIIRDNDLIQHDSDVDILIPIEHITWDIFEEIIKTGFNFKYRFGTIEEGLEIALWRDGVKVDLFFHYPNDNNEGRTYIWKNKKPLTYEYSNFKTKLITWKGMDIRIPEDPIKDVLKPNYGPNWKTPDKNWDWAFSAENLNIKPFKTKQDFIKHFNSQSPLPNVFDDKHSSILLYLKTNLNKDLFDVTGLQNPFERFDKIYCVNIDFSIKRWVHFKQVAEEYGFYHLVKRWSATFHHIGGYGCSMSHKEILHDAKTNGYKNILIFEDDIYFLYGKRYVWEVLNKALDQKPDYDIMYVGVNLKACNEENCDVIKLSDSLSSISGRYVYGTFGMIHKNKGLSVYDSIEEDVNKFTINDRNDTTIANSKNIKKVVMNPQLLNVIDSFGSYSLSGLRSIKKDDTILPNESHIFNSYIKFNLIDEDNLL